MLKSAQRTALVIGAMLCAVPPPSAVAEPFNLQGAWATDAENCKKVFARKNGRLVLSEDSDIYGGGFTIDANRITGKMARCAITNRKTDGDTIHLLAACATDIMLSNVQFSLRVRDDNGVTRIFPGMDGIEINYNRCAL